jgi:hypothetical protein
MPAAYNDLYMEQNSSYNTTITLADNYGNAYNLYSFTVASKARRSYYSANASLVFNTTIIDAANGVITLSANSATTANLIPGKLVYDVIITDPYNTVTRVLEGQIFIDPAATY